MYNTAQPENMPAWEYDKCLEARHRANAAHGGCHALGGLEVAGHYGLAAGTDTVAHCIGSMNHAENVTHAPAVRTASAAG